jgi:hypothetical protein
MYFSSFSAGIITLNFGALPLIDGLWAAKVRNSYLMAS